MAIVTAHVAAVQELYVAYFGRPADTGGLDYWTNIVEAQGTTAAVSASFAQSPEYIVSFFGMTNAQVVDKIYANLFGRAGSTTDGRGYWVDLLNKGTVSVNTIVAEVAKGAQTTDKEAVENKVAAATAFTAAIDTPAEVSGYAGNSALTLAKAFITGVTTDATLTAAIAPASLNATVAAVVKAGTPFSLNASLEALATANDNLADFLEDNNYATSAAATADLTADVNTAMAAVDTLVAGDYTSGTAAGVRAALLTEQQRVNTAALASANTTLAAANAEAAAVTGLSAAIANVRSATEARDAAIEAADEAEVDLSVAESTFELRSNTTLTIDADGTATIPGTGTGATPVDVLVLNARGQVTIATGVTETTHPGVTALRDAVIANLDAAADETAAVNALATANTELTALGNTAIVGRVNTAFAGVETAQDNIDALAEAVADLQEATALRTEFNGYTTAVTEANAAFTNNGFRAPVTLDETVAGSNTATATATSGSDIFAIGDAETVTISSFGRSGTDSLYIGTGYTVGADIEAGNNAALEVFFVQNGTRAEVHVEQAVFGSASDDVTIITLVGVDATDLQLVNGIVSLKAAA